MQMRIQLEWTGEVGLLSEGCNVEQSYDVPTAGFSRYMFTVEEKDGVYATNFISKLSIPRHLRLVKHSSETLFHLFEWKVSLSPVIWERKMLIVVI